MSFIRPNVRKFGEFVIAMDTISARMGLVVDEYAEVPATRYEVDRRKFFDTTIASKSNQGHRFPDVLTEPEKGSGS